MCPNFLKIGEIMPKVTINDEKGVLIEPGSGLAIENGNLQIARSLGGDPNETTSLVSSSEPPLLSSIVTRIQTTSNGHRVKLPLASGPGQVMIIRVVGSHNVNVRNNANDANVVAALAAGKTAMCFSTAAGDNWVGNAVD
jgi:hypothetical protein